MWSGLVSVGDGGAGSTAHRCVCSVCNAAGIVGTVAFARRGQSILGQCYAMPLPLPSYHSRGSLQTESHVPRREEGTSDTKGRRGTQPQDGSFYAQTSLSMAAVGLSLVSSLPLVREGRCATLVSFSSNECGQKRTFDHGMLARVGSALRPRNRLEHCEYAHSQERSTE